MTCNILYSLNRTQPFMTFLVVVTMMMMIKKKALIQEATVVCDFHAYWTITYTLFILFLANGVMKATCIECGVEFRTYIPGRDCFLDDGSLVGCHQQPEEKCPLCEPSYIGSALNPNLNN